MKTIPSRNSRIAFIFKLSTFLNTDVSSPPSIAVMIFVNVPLLKASETFDDGLM